MLDFENIHSACVFAVMMHVRQLVPHYVGVCVNGAVSIDLNIDAVCVQNQNFDQRNSPRITPITDDRSGTEVLREEQRKLAEQEEMAAAKIQAGFRAYKTRKELKQKHMEEEISGGRESMASLMRDEPLPLEGDDDWGPGPAGDNQVKEAEEKAAVTLQAGFRGYKARQEVKAMRTNQEVKDKGEETPPARQQTPPSPMTNNPSTTPTQTMANDISQAEAEHAAATKIQATFRGHQTRKELARAQATGQEEVAVAEGTEQNINTQYWLDSHSHNHIAWSD